MPRANIRKKLPSYRISREFLSALEAYFQTSVPGIIGEEAKRISFEMTDRRGTKKALTPDEISTPSFLNGTKELGMSYETASLDIDLCFARKWDITAISFGYSEADTMEKALAVYDSLRSALRPYRVWNGYVYSLDHVGPILMMVFSFPAVIFRFDENITLSWLAGWLLFISLRFCTPFTEFDDRMRRVRRHVFWFIGSAIIVGTGIVLFKKYVLDL